MEVAIPIGPGCWFYRIILWILLSDLISSFSGKLIIRYLPYVMDHAVQQPLDIYLDLAPQGKPIKPFVGSDVCEYRLYDGHPLWIDSAPLFTLDLIYHELVEVHTIRSYGDRQAFGPRTISVDAFPL